MELFCALDFAQIVICNLNDVKVKKQYFYKEIILFFIYLEIYFLADIRANEEFLIEKNPHFFFRLPIRFGYAKNKP